MLTVTQVAERLGIQPGAVRDAIARGSLAAIRTGGSDKKAGHLLVLIDEVERYEREVKGRHGPRPRKPKEADA